jgi:hypothetical protein
MAPEIAAVYVIGMIPGGLFSTFHYLRRKARSTSRASRQLQSNLKKINLCWIDLHGEVAAYRLDIESFQSEALKKTFLLGTVATMAASWLGLFFHLLVFFSLEKFAVSRFESRLFQSDLVQTELSAQQVQQQLDEIRAQVF